jgi:hypothetical protein
MAKEKQLVRWYLRWLELCNIAITLIFLAYIWLLVGLVIMPPIKVLASVALGLCGLGLLFLLAGTVGFYKAEKARKEYDDAMGFSFRFKEQK